MRRALEKSVLGEGMCRGPAMGSWPQPYNHQHAPDLPEKRPPSWKRNQGGIDTDKDLRSIKADQQSLSLRLIKQRNLSEGRLARARAQKEKRKTSWAPHGVVAQSGRGSLQLVRASIGNSPSVSGWALLRESGHKGGEAPERERSKPNVPGYGYRVPIITV